MGSRRAPSTMASDSVGSTAGAGLYSGVDTAESGDSGSAVAGVLTGVDTGTAGDGVGSTAGAGLYSGVDTAESGDSGSAVARGAWVTVSMSVPQETARRITGIAKKTDLNIWPEHKYAAMTIPSKPETELSYPARRAIYPSEGTSYRSM